jgi:hypothetical protein
MSDRTVAIGVMVGIFLIGCMLVLLFSYLRHRHDEHAEEIEALHGKADELVKHSSETKDHVEDHVKESRYTQHRIMTRLQWLLAVFHPTPKRKDSEK